jgi:hypothetical protein
MLIHKLGWNKGSAAIFLAGLGAVAIAAHAETATPGVLKDSTPTPYHRVEGFAGTLPKAQQWGAVTGVAIYGGHLWVVERCGQNSCDGSPDDPIIEFDMNGKPIKSFGGGLFVSPHGLTFDKEGNFYIADYQGKPGKGHVVYKFNQDGKILMTLGTPGVAGDGPNQFNEPNEVAIAPNGDLFVANGHSIKPDSAARIVKLSPDGKFIKAWGKLGTGPGEFRFPIRFASTVWGGYGLRTAPTTACRYSIRMENTSPSTSSLDGRWGSILKATRLSWPTRNQRLRQIRDIHAAGELPSATGRHSK